MQSCRLLTRALSTSVRRSQATRIHFENQKALGEVPNAEGYKKIMDLQKQMCEDDGLMVWQKRGGRDMGGYYFTMALMGGGLAYTVYMLYTLSMPKKAD